MRNLDTALLRSFVAVAETGSVTATAHQLHLTQAAVSQQIKRLEEQLAVELFRREGRRLRLADAGERLLARARRLVALNDEIWQLMRMPEMAGEVRLGMPHDLVAPYLPPILAAFDRACPRVRVHIDDRISVELLEAMADGTIDLCLTTEQGIGAGGETLLRERLTWAQVRGGSAARKVPLPLAVGAETCCFRIPAVQALAKVEREFRIACDTSQMQTMMATVEADLAVTALLPSSLPPGLELVPAEIGLPPLPLFAVNLYVRAAGATPAVEAMAAHIRRHVVTKVAAPRSAMDLAS